MSVDQLFLIKRNVENHSLSTASDFPSKPLPQLYGLPHISHKIYLNSPIAQISNMPVKEFIFSKNNENGTPSQAVFKDSM